MKQFKRIYAIIACIGTFIGGTALAGMAAENVFNWLSE